MSAFRASTLKYLAVDGIYFFNRLNTFQLGLIFGSYIENMASFGILIFFSYYRTPKRRRNNDVGFVGFEAILLAQKAST